MRLGDTRSNRIDPALLDTCHPDHRARYEFAASHVTGSVLDAGCGFGYGSGLLLAHAESVLGVDLYAEAISYAREHHATDAVSFELADVSELDRGPFDAVVCLEAVEHVEDDVGFVRALRGLLKPGGNLVISTPNKLITSPDGVPRDPTHVREYTPDEFRALLSSAGFESVALYGLHLDASVFARHRVRRKMGKFDRVGVKRLLPKRLKAAVVSRVAGGSDEPARIDTNVAAAHDQIAVAR